MGGDGVKDIGNVVYRGYIWGKSIERVEGLWEKGVGNMRSFV